MIRPEIFSYKSSELWDVHVPKTEQVQYVISIFGDSSLNI